tara:strand:- start:3820 stop:4956 length:1137 start_codon:yes stop_codon:yes gene_type:complete
MNKKLLSWLLLICALGLSSTAAYYSVVGLSIIFAGVAIPVIIMGSFLEASKIIIATYLHNQWKKTYTGLKIYLTLSLIVLSVITSIGIYGLLSKGFQTNITKMEIDSKRVANIEVKKNRFQSTKQEYVVEKQNIDGDVSQLREALSTGTMTQYKDRETGQIITVNSSRARKTFEKQLERALGDKDTMSMKIESLNDSITNLEFTILNMEIDNEVGSELGVIKAFSELTGWTLQAVANLFILILIFVFDPLAITLIIATNQSFKDSKTKKNMYGEDKIEEEKKTFNVPVGVMTPPTIEEVIETYKKPIEPSQQQWGEFQTPPISNTNPTPQEQISSLHDQIRTISNASVSGRKKVAAIEPLKHQIQILKNQIEGNQKTY